MFFQHVYDKTLAQASYFIGCQKAGVAAVIDAKRDVESRHLQAFCHADLVVVPRVLQRGAHLGHGERAEGIAHLGAVDGDLGDAGSLAGGVLVADIAVVPRTHPLARGDDARVARVGQSWRALGHDGREGVSGAGIELLRHRRLLRVGRRGSPAAPNLVRPTLVRMAALPLRAVDVAPGPAGIEAARAAIMDGETRL